MSENINQEVNENEVVEVAQIKVLELEPAMEIAEHKVSVTAINVVNLDENGKKLTTQRCSISNKSCRYLFSLEREDGETIQVSAEVLRNNLGQEQKFVDKLYSIAYYDENPASSTKITDEAKAEALANFLG